MSPTGAQNRRRPSRKLLLTLVLVVLAVYAITIYIQSA